MAQSINKVIILGNVGADPEIRNTPNGTQVANFRVACTESWKDNNGQKHERTEWVTCVAWRGLAEVVQKIVRKGSKVYVEGKLQTRSWEDKNGGGKRYATEIIAGDVVLCSGGNGGSHPVGGAQSSLEDDFGPGAGTAPAGADDDLPF